MSKVKAGARQQGREGMYRAMPVSLPFGEQYSVITIVSDMEHIGNWIAEGRMHPSLFWPELARLKSLRAKQKRQQFRDHLDQVERRVYAEAWPRRWMDQQEQLAEMFKQ